MSIPRIRRIEILQEIDGIFCDVHPKAFGFEEKLFSNDKGFKNLYLIDWMLYRHDW